MKEVPFVVAKIWKFTDPMPSKIDTNWLIRTEVQTTKNQRFSFDQNEDLIRKESYRLKKDLIETPRSKQDFTSFASKFKEIQKDPVQAVVRQVLSQVFDYPSKIHWRILMELAEYLKREIKVDDAWILYKIVTWIQPYAYQGWLEQAKLEEEIGNHSKCG